MEVITEKVTNIAMGSDIDKITEFEDVIDLPVEMEPKRKPEMEPKREPALEPA